MAKPQDQGRPQGSGPEVSQAVQVDGPHPSMGDVEASGEVMSIPNGYKGSLDRSVVTDEPPKGEWKGAQSKPPYTTVGELKQRVYEAVDEHLNSGGCAWLGTPPSLWCVACKTSVALIFEKHEKHGSDQ